MNFNYKYQDKSLAAFGCVLTEREFTTEKYRYGFNGMEKDDEVSGEGNSYTAEFWQYDSRLGRRWNIDPITYPWQSTYAAFNDNPIYFNDPSGLEGEEPKKGTVQKGEGAYRTATRYGISMKQLAAWNSSVFPQGLKSGTYMLHPGQQLNVSAPKTGEDKIKVPVLSSESAPANKPILDQGDKTIAKDNTAAEKLGIEKPKQGVSQSRMERLKKWAEHFDKTAGTESMAGEIDDAAFTDDKLGKPGEPNTIPDVPEMLGDWLWGKEEEKKEEENRRIVIRAMNNIMGVPWDEIKDKDTLLSPYILSTGTSGFSVIKKEDSIHGSSVKIQRGDSTWKYRYKRLDKNIGHYKNVKWIETW